MGETISEEHISPAVKSKPVRDINNVVAAMLREYASILKSQGADRFRIDAYRRAADTISNSEETVSSILWAQGQPGLVALEGVGKSIASVITEIVETGCWTQLSRLRGNHTPEAIFRSVPGIGPQLARQLVETYHFESLEDLESALSSDKIPIKGFGPRRREAIAAILSQRLGRRFYPFAVQDDDPPSSNLILKVDAMYRERVKKGTLRCIAPKRFNPEHKAWLPVMHASHEQWHFTAMYSNSLQAHRFGKTDDWVVIYFQTDGHPEGRCTVVTETRGKKKGQRVVRGRDVGVG